MPTKSPLRKSLERQIAELEQELAATQAGGPVRAIQKRRINRRLAERRALLADAEAAAARGTARRTERLRKERAARARRQLGIS